MIINGNPAGNTRFWGDHLLRDDTNARAEVVEIAGLLAKDLPTALREMAAVGAQSRSHGNFLYQANHQTHAPANACHRPSGAKHSTRSKRILD